MAKSDSHLVADVANVSIRGSTTALRSHLVFFVRSTHDDLQRLVRQGTLERLSFLPRRTHLHIALFVRGKMIRMALRCATARSLHYLMFGLTFNLQVFDLRDLPGPSKF
jgi:hypothetical protein